jgi:hypothetical protein
MTTQQDRERQVANAYVKWWDGNYYNLRSDDSNWNRFIQSESYLSIPPATDELRERIKARILELKDNIQSMRGYEATELWILQNLLKQ